MTVLLVKMRMEVSESGSGESCGQTTSEEAGVIGHERKSTRQQEVQSSEGALDWVKGQLEGRCSRVKILSGCRRLGVLGDRVHTLV